MLLSTGTRARTKLIYLDKEQNAVYSADARCGLRRRVILPMKPSMPATSMSCGVPEAAARPPTSPIHGSSGNRLENESFRPCRVRGMYLPVCGYVGIVTPTIKRNTQSRPEPPCPPPPASEELVPCSPRAARQRKMTWKSMSFHSKPSQSRVSCWCCCAMPPNMMPTPSSTVRYISTAS